MNIKKLAVEFITVFVVALITVATVTFLWDFIRHGENSVDWETSFRFATIFGITLTGVKSREIKEKNRVFKNLKHQEEGKNEKNHSIHDFIYGADSLHRAPTSGGA